MSRIRQIALSLLLCGLLCSAACRPRYSYEIPEQTGDGWPTADLGPTGIDRRPLFRLVRRIETGKIANIHGILIVREGKIVFEEYFDGHRFAYDKPELRGELVRFDRYTPHNTMSVTKAVTAAVVGIGIEQGLIPSEREPICSFFPDYAHHFDGGKTAIQIEHLLTMSSGLSWNEWDVPLTSLDNDLIKLFIVSDPVDFILGKALLHEPGSFWYYSGGDVNLLGVLFERAAGRSIDEFCAEHLFRPMQISDFQWNYINDEIVYASGELFLTPRDMAKFGHLYLNGGVWNGKRIIAEQWIAKSLRACISTGGRAVEGNSYGYQWWQRSFPLAGESVRAFVRTGWGGQAILLFPSLDTLVVFTAGNYGEPDPLFDLVVDYVLPAIGG